MLDFLMGMAALLGSLAVFAIIILLVFKATIIIKAANAILEMPLFWKYFFDELRKEQNK